MSALRRQTILRNALVCFAEKGLHGTTLDDIHRRAAVSIGSIYHHFGTKQHLASEVYVAGLQAYHHALLAELVQYTGAQSGIEALVRVDVRRLGTPGLWSRVTFPSTEGWLEPGAASDSAALRQVFAADLSGWLEPHITQGEILPLPIALYLAILFGPTRELAEHWEPSRRVATMAVAEEALPRAAWAALRGAPAAN